MDKCLCIGPRVFHEVVMSINYGFRVISISICHSWTPVKFTGKTFIFRDFL